MFVSYVGVGGGYEETFGTPATARLSSCFFFSDLCQNNWVRVLFSYFVMM